MHSVNAVRQLEIHTPEPLVPGPICLKVETSIAKLKKYKFPGRDQIPLELIQAGSETLLPVVHKLINSVWNKEVLNIWSLVRQCTCLATSHRRKIGITEQELLEESIL
jgi:hypothetical protein